MKRNCLQCVSPQKRFVTTCTSGSTRDNLIASIRFSLGCQSAFFTSKKTLECAWKHQLCLSPRIAERGAKKRHTWSPTDPRGGGQQKVAQYSLSPVLSSHYGKMYPAPAEGHRPPGSKKGSSCSSPATQESAEPAYLMYSSYICASKTAVAVFNTWCNAGGWVGLLLPGTT